jgi:hypothetical protein
MVRASDMRYYIWYPTPMSKRFHSPTFATCRDMNENAIDCAGELGGGAAE